VHSLEREQELRDFQPTTVDCACSSLAKNVLDSDLRANLGFSLLVLSRLFLLPKRKDRAMQMLYPLRNPTVIFKKETEVYEVGIPDRLDSSSREVVDCRLFYKII
jgi:hypothetical protein